MQIISALKEYTAGSKVFINTIKAKYTVQRECTTTAFRQCLVSTNLPSQILNFIK